MSHMRLFQSKYDYIKRHIKKFLQLQEPIDAQIQNEWRKRIKGVVSTHVAMVFKGIAATQHIKTQEQIHTLLPVELFLKVQRPWLCVS